MCEKNLLFKLMMKSLSWLFFLLIGSLALFGDDFFTLVVTLLVGFPGAFLFATGAEIAEANITNVTSREISSNKSVTKCVWSLSILAVSYNAIAIFLLYLLGQYPFRLSGIFSLVLIEVSILALVLLLELAQTKKWPPISLLFLCGCLAINKEKQN